MHLSFRLLVSRSIKPIHRSNSRRGVRLPCEDRSGTVILTSAFLELTTLGENNSKKRSFCEDFFACLLMKSSFRLSFCFVP